MVLPELYFSLYHGRRTVDEDLDDWGRNGPRFRNFGQCFITYGSSIRLIYRQPCDDLDEVYFTISEGGLVYYDGWYYGDFSLELATDLVTGDFATYSRELAKWPEPPARSKRVPDIVSRYATLPGTRRRLC